MSSLFDVARLAATSPLEPGLITLQHTLSWSQLWSLTKRAERWLARHAADKATPVGLVAVPEPEQIAMAYALLRRGTPLLTLHPRSTAAERSTLLALSAAQAVVDPGWFHSLSPGTPDDEPAIPGTVVDDERLLALLPTSGSTGAPRIVKLSRRAFAAAARASERNLGWQPDDAWLLALPFAHIGGLGVVTRCLAAGRPIVVGDQNGAPLPLGEALRLLPATLASVVPTQLERLLAAPGPALPQRVRAVLVGGAQVSSNLLRQAYARGVPALPTYGMTEACSQICTAALGSSDPDVGAGKPLSHCEVKIEGEHILIRGDTLFSGYLGEAGEWAPADWFDTGDRGRLDEQGQLHVLGRGDDLIITGGENVYPREVEQVLEAALPELCLCVFGVPDAIWGHSPCVAVEGTTPEDLAALRPRLLAALHGALPRYKHPRYVLTLSELPRTESGKLARAALHARASERLPL